MNPVTPGMGGGLREVMDLRRQIVERSEALRSLRDAGEAGQTLAPPAGGGFADVLKGAVQTVNQTQTRSSDIAAAYERGEVTDVAQVILARQESGIAFEATLQVRNKLLSAYQDIMRMGV